MARILAISSQVARGTVGLSIVVPALQALGHEVIGLPTVLLSNHPGHAHAAGMRVEPEVLRGMFGALEANGWLAGVDGVLTGYLPSAEHVAFAAEAVRRVRAASPGMTYLCDPVMGDYPKGLYIAEDAARAILAELVPMADIMTPNEFELWYVSVRGEAKPAGLLADDVACTAFGGTTVVATSMRKHAPEALQNLLWGPGARAWTDVPTRPNVPNGTGDLFAALYLACYLQGRDAVAALGFATAGVDATLEASRGMDQLALHALMPHPPQWVNWPVES